MGATVDVADPATLAREVGQVVSKVRSRRELALLELPELDTLCARTGKDREELLSAAIGEVADDTYRRFLEILLPFPLPEAGRWPALGRRHVSDHDTGRGVRAGFEVFGISSWDGLTARTDELGGKSRRELAEEHLAAALLQLAAVEGPRPADPGRPPGRRAKGWVMAAAIAVLAVAGVTIAVTRDDRADTDPDAGADVAVDPDCVDVGEVGAVKLPWTAASARAAIEDALAGSNLDADTVCAKGPIESWGELVVQKIEHPTLPIPDALVGMPDGSAIHLPAAVFAGYYQIGGRDGGGAQSSAGFPVAIHRTPDGPIEVSFTKGTLLIGEVEEGPFFWIGAPFVEWYRAHPELGIPAGNPLSDLTQDFVNGRARIDLTPAGGVPVAELIPQRTQALPTERAGRILRQPDATAWWIDDQDRRHWIVDGATWTCLGGDRVAAAAPGYAVAALPLGDPATCDEG